MMEQSYSRWQKLMERAKRENWGMLPSPPDERDWPLSRIAVPVALPRSVRLDSLIYRIKDQGQCGTCVGKAVSSATETGYKQKKKLPKEGLSSLFIYARAKQEDGIPDVQGTYPRVALKIAQKEGTVPESIFPYVLLRDCNKPPIPSESIQAHAEYKIKAYARLWTLEEIKQALASGKIVVGGILVTNSFVDWNGQNTISVPEGIILGAHAVVFCGYDDERKAIRGVNSWGLQWGDKGFFWLSYDFFSWQSDIGMAGLLEAWAVEFEEILQPPQKIELWIDRPIAIVNGAEVMIDPANPKVVPKIIEGRTMLPARFIAESLGKKVSWASKERKVTIE